MAEFINSIDLLGDKECLGGLVSNTIYEFKDDMLNTLCNQAFYKNNALNKVALPSVESLQSKSFYSCYSIKEVDLHNLKQIDTSGGFAISFLYSLTELLTPELTKISSSNYLTHVPIKYMELPAYDGYSISSNFSTGYGVSILDVSKITAIISNNFKNDYNLTSLILRNTDVVSLQNINAFSGTAIEVGYGYIYVPSNLVDSYKSAANWSTFADQIVSIDEYPKKCDGGTITDTWEQIFQAEANNTYKTKYSIGDTKALNINGACVLMQIVAFDEDELADDSGKAKITWLSVGLICNIPTTIDNTNYVTWELSYVRNYLQEIIYPSIDTIVKNNIKTVRKISSIATKNSLRENIETDDTVWIPSFYELTGVSDAPYSEKAGALYTEIFGNNVADTRKIKKQGPCASGSNVTWRTRTHMSGDAFAGVNSNSGNTTSGYGGDQPCPIGFCT